jgi:iron complex outermembrane receptor protein
MKNIIILVFFISFFHYSQTVSIKGIVVDSETMSALQYANVSIKGTSFGTSSDEKGVFTINGTFNTTDTLIVSYLGYRPFSSVISVIQTDFIVVKLDRIILPSQTILVEAIVGKKGITPVSFEAITKDDIIKDYIVQDIPSYLSQLPSTTFYSENGNGIGYNYLSIRGFDQRRISVSINGIPQNDPEDHNVYWIDFPDLLASTELIQVQRGAESGVVGYPAIGGSINIITSPFSEKIKFNLEAAIGSFNTKKYSTSFSSGLIGNKYSIYAKISQILSSGYRNSSWSKLNSYHISAVRYDAKFMTQLNIFGGVISDGLAYTGLAKFAVKDESERIKNYSYWEADENNYIFTLERRPEEIENFSQPHFELLNEYNFNNNVKINSALFLVLGTGFFDYDGSWSVFYDDYFRLKQNGFDSSFTPTNALIRAQVENKQFGWIPKISFNHTNGQLILGGELRLHRSDHWGSINYAENLPPGVTKEYRYYFYNGAKDIFNGFIHETYKLNDKINLLAELQIAYHKYELYNEKYLNNNFSVNDLFFNPRLGINYKIEDSFNLFFSFARVSREPRLKNYYDAAESSAGETPQFELNPDGSYNYDKPLVKPETMNDFELGFSFSQSNFNFDLNLYYMNFEDEIVKNGKVDRFGQPITGNVERTVHTGAEINFVYNFWNKFRLFGNANYSSNKIINGKYFINENEVIDISDNSISGFPDFLANIGLQFRDDNFFFQLTGKYVGAFYSDNFDSKISDYLTTYPGFIDYKDNLNEEYFTFDLLGSYELNLFNAANNSKIYIQINNVFSKLYSSFAIGKEFFPAATRSFIAGFQLGL